MLYLVADYEPLHSRTSKACWCSQTVYAYVYTYVYSRFQKDENNVPYHMHPAATRQIGDAMLCSSDWPGQGLIAN